MKLVRPVLAVAAVLLPIGVLGHPAYAHDPAYVAGQHLDTGLHLRLDDYGRFGTFSYSVDSEAGSALGSEAGESLAAYCFDLDLRYRPGAALRETAWDDVAHASASVDQVSWLLHNSYPMLPLDQLHGAQEFRDGLSVREAVTATQAAIWHYTNGVSLSTSDVVGTADEQHDVMSLYSYLTGPQNIGPAGSAPGTLSLSAPETGGVAGQLIGPIVLTTDIPALLSIDDVDGDWRLVAADGTPIEGPVESTEVFLEVAQDAMAGEATITAAAATELPATRIFVPAHLDPGSSTQPLVTATTQLVTLKAEVAVSWTATPTVDPEPPLTQPDPPGTTAEAPVTEPEQPSTDPEPPVTEPDEPTTAPEPAVAEPEPAVVPGPQPPAASPVHSTPATAPVEPLADTGADAGRWALAAGSAILVGLSGILLARRAR